MTKVLKRYAKVLLLGDMRYKEHPTFTQTNGLVHLNLNAFVGDNDAEANGMILIGGRRIQLMLQ